MNREFLDLYNSELGLLKEQGKEFAEAYPEIAERLGGLLAERSDPMISGLLEGAAFLAARVQLKIKHEFPEFTHNLLEQLVPNYLAPTPSVMLLQARPKFGDAVLRGGVRLARGGYLDAHYRDGERPQSCRFRLTSDVILFPFELSAAEYFTTPAPLQALKIPVGADVMGGLRIALNHRFAATTALESADKTADSKPEFWFSGCNVSTLPIHFLGAEGDCDALYEAIHSRRVGLYFRYMKDGEPVVVRADDVTVTQLGFRDDEALFDNANRVFTGFDLLREYFVFPRKFFGFRLEGLAATIKKLQARQVDLIMTFREVNGRLAAAVKPSMFALYAAPAVNLFEMQTDRVPIAARQHEFHVVPDRSRTLDFEPIRITKVFAHRRGGVEQTEVHPLYAPHVEQAGARAPLAYTTRRLPRRRSQREQTSARRSEYVGTDLFISLIDPKQSSSEEAVVELSVRALCSNRHLPEHLPTGEKGADIRHLENLEIPFVGLAGPTKPRESVVSQLRTSGAVASTGSVAWRLINLLSLNHLGLTQRGAGANAEALREALTTFACLPDQATERRLRGLRNVDSAPVVRRLQRREGAAVARGTQVRVTLEEAAFEGFGLFLFGAVLDRFLCEYAGFNHFTETVIVSTERGEVMRWPARTGLRRSL